MLSAAAKAVGTVRRIGFRPGLMAAAAANRAGERWRRGRLRRNYDGLVVAPGGGVGLRLPVVGLGRVGGLPEGLVGAAERVRGEAEMVCRHEVDFLGSGPTGLGERIDWLRDFKSGYRWPAVFYMDVQVTRLDDASDAKVPWELSRGHQLLTLARAAVLFGEERFAAELEAQLSSWLEANPPGVGINWVTPMEVAIRAVNWVWAIAIVEELRPLEAGLRGRVTRALQAHARHIRLNLEGSPLLRGNHYLSDVVGLFVLAHCLQGDPRAPRWERFARRALEREVRSQVLFDGVGFEASLPYHGLVLELLLVSWHVAEAAGRPLSASYRERVGAMLDASRALRHPRGRIPLFGDGDSGRVLPAGFGRPPTHDPLLDLGAALLGRPRPRDAAPHEEVAWTLGVDAWRALAARHVDARVPASAFPDGGLYVLRGGGAHMVVRWGGIGRHNGGHAHNDLSSFELSFGGEPVVLDSGTYAYTGDVAARDRFRSARAHNVAVVGGRDMRPLPVGQPFVLPEHATFAVETWDEGSERTVLVGHHDGFSRAGEHVVVRRRVELDRRTGTVEIADEVDGAGAERVESLVHLAPGADPAGIVFEGAADVEVTEDWVSDRYGRRVRAPLVRARAAPGVPARLAYRLDPARLSAPIPPGRSGP